jgi:hypothetical protein
MRKILISLATGLILFSCQKDSSFLTENDNTQIAKKSKDYVVLSESTDIWNFPIKLDNQCYPEIADFPGGISYDVQWLQDGEAYYISYDIDFSNFSGTGESSGLEYSPSRTRYKGIIPQEIEITENGTILGRIVLNMDFKAKAGNTLNVTEGIVFTLTKAADISVAFYSTAAGCK